jgi:F-type H+-transporting ATPase subunit b
VSIVELFGAAQAWASAAAEAEHHAPSINQIWFPIANFVIFIFIIVRYALPVVRDFLHSRREEVLTAIRQASTKKLQAEAVVQEYKERLVRLDQEVRSIQASLRAEGEREKSKLLKEAEALAAKTKQDTQFLADQEVKLARQKIREEMATVAEATARELMARNLSGADQSRLIEDFIQNIGQVR